MIQSNERPHKFYTCVFRSVLLVLALTLAASAHAGNLGERLLHLDLAARAQERTPDWTAPRAMLVEEGAVVTEELLARLKSGHGVYGKYVWANGRWHWLGVRASDPSLGGEGQRGLERLGQGRYEDLTLDDIRSPHPTPMDFPVTPCTDDPEQRTPEESNPSPGEEHVIRWINTVQECDYEATFRYTSGGGGVWAWFLIGFEYTFTGDTIGPDPGEDDTR